MNLINFPFTPKKLPFFYGWFIVVCSVLGMVVSIPGQTIGFSAFTHHVVLALHIDDGFLSDAYALGTIISGFSIPLAGKFYDRFGARVMAVLASIGLGLVLLVLSRLENIAKLLNYNSTYLFVLLTLLCFLLRYFGQGSITLVSRNITMKWFSLYRGRVSAISGVFVSLLFSAGPLFFNFLIKHSSWSLAWQYMGFAIGIGFTLFALVFFRDNPTECGLAVDGLDESLAAETIVKDNSFDLSVVKETQVFWLFTLTFAMMSLYITGFTFHIASIFTIAGRGNIQAFGTFLPATIISILVNLSVGWVSDRLELTFLLMIMLGAMALSLSGAIVLETRWGYWSVIIGNGIAGGLFGLLTQVTWPRFFGTKHLGAISAKMMMFLVMGSAMGPPLYARSKLWMNSYNLASLTCLSCVLVLLVWAFFVPIPDVSRSASKK